MILYCSGGVRTIVLRELAREDSANFSHISSCFSMSARYGPLAGKDRGARKESEIGTGKAAAISLVGNSAELSTGTVLEGGRKEVRRTITRRGPGFDEGPGLRWNWTDCAGSIRTRRESACYYIEFCGPITFSVHTVRVCGGIIC